jgi:tetratricopeptide (TPR) repeat protein
MFTFNSFAQKEITSPIVKKNEVAQKEPDTVIEVKPSLKRIIKSYYVEENINMKFGGYATTYEVSQFSLINSCYLGPNNTRIITPRYGEVNQLEFNQIEDNKNLINKKLLEPIKINIKIPQYKEVELPKQNQLETPTEPSKVKEKEALNNSEKSEKYIYIHLMETYQRIAEKGTKSIEIFKKLGDFYFFEAEYTKAIKWYEELFQLTAHLDSEYYDRYAYSLKAIGKKNKANEIIKKRNLLFDK